MQPGLKVRGREYLWIVYSPDYADALDVLRQRHLGRNRSLALREHGLGWDAPTRFVDREPLWRVHQMVFAMLWSPSRSTRGCDAARSTIVHRTLTGLGSTLPSLRARRATSGA